MLIIQLITLVLILSIIKSFMPAGHKVFSLIISIFLAFLFVIQLSSVIITGDIADYRFYENFNLGDALSVAGFFGKEGILVAIALIISIGIIHYLGKRLRNIHRKLPMVLSLLAGLIVLGLPGGILGNAYDSVRLKFAGDASFNEALLSLNIDAKTYVEKEKIKATKGKNIIVLSLESLEKGYLGEKLKHLTPRLSALAKENTFYTMKQTPAGGWTSASMYSVITGVPAFFGTHGNSVFQNSYENKLTTLADVLKNAGYDLQYFIGKKEYSGIDDMLKTLGFTVKSEKDFETQYETVDWGIQDLDLFTEFKKEIRLKKEANQPFALFLSTISTHFPNGVPDKRIDSLLPPQKSRLELMASATDYFIGDLIDFLGAEGLLGNTVFYIYPDHLLMGNKSRVVEDFEERSLFLLTNADTAQTGYPVQEDIYQIDLPKIILAGAEIKHNAQFLTDYVHEKDKNAFLRKNDENLLRLNDAALKTLNCQEGIYVVLNSEKWAFDIKNKDQLVVDTYTLPDSGSCQRILFDENLRPFDDYMIRISEVLKPPKAYAYMDVFMTDGLLYASLKGGYHFGITKNDQAAVVFDIRDLNLLQNIQLREDLQNSIVIKSNGWNAKLPSSFIIKGKEVLVERGLTLIILNPTSGYEYRTFDTYGSATDAEAFLATLQKLKNDQAVYLILAHDSAANSLEPYSEALEQVGFKILSKLMDRQAYIANVLDGKLTERVDDISLKMAAAYPTYLKNNTRYFAPERMDFTPTPDRYIAHAGGAIDGIKYTNSKEALDFSYEQGFRLFELDIMETSDRHYVAAHDWTHWAKETDFKGAVPVSKSEFMHHKIRGKYHPLDMDGINTWFSEHPDATLVTDKVNDPKKFGAQFMGKGRLVMELFTLPALEAAYDSGVMALVSEPILNKIKGNEVAYLKKHQVEHVGISRRLLESKRELMDEFRENGIKVYVYHVNFDAGKDERYVFENELGIVYGMYADTWLSIFTENQKQP